MVYRAIGLMSGSSLDGLDIAFVEFHEQAGKWSYSILEAECYAYTEEWVSQLKNAVQLNGRDYQLLHSRYGHYTGELVNQFIEKHQLHYKVALIASHGHTSFHMPAQKMTGQLGDGAAIAATTGLPVVSDLRAMDVALGGQGAPIVPIGERLLLPGYNYFLNIGGITNVSINTDPYLAFDICPANRVLNMLANEAGLPFDKNGAMAATGTVDQQLLDKLNGLDYYRQPAPKSLANDFGTDIVYPLIKESGVALNNALRTYVEQIAFQIGESLSVSQNDQPSTTNPQLLVTGGGALNSFLIERVKYYLENKHIDLVVPETNLVNYKEALIMAFIGVLRWRQENNVLSSVTGASRDSIGGALWAGA
jgi:anhydro-N-acetylmuramic acid kinase